MSTRKKKPVNRLLDYVYVMTSAIKILVTDESESDVEVA